MTAPISVESYASFCGPQALWACFVEPGRALLSSACARDLLKIQRARGRVTTPATSLEDLSLVLIRRGFSVEPWDIPADRPTESAAGYAARLEREIAEHAAGRNRPAAPVSPFAVAEFIASVGDPDEAERLTDLHMTRFAGLSTLRAWIANRDGLWLVVVRALTVHLLAVRDGEIVAGGQDGIWQDKPVTEALCVRRP